MSDWWLGFLTGGLAAFYVCSLPKASREMADWLVARARRKRLESVGVDDVDS